MKIPDILARESDNQRNVYVYEEEDGRWYAYESSAHRICRILEGLVTTSPFTFRKLMHKVTVDRAEISLSDLLRCPITLCSDSEIVIEYPNQLYQRN